MTRRLALCGSPCLMLGVLVFVVVFDHIPEEQRAAKALFDRRAAVTGETEIGGVGICRYCLSRK